MKKKTSMINHIPIKQVTKKKYGWMKNYQRTQWKKKKVFYNISQDQSSKIG